MIHGALGGENALGMAGGFEPAPLSLSLSGGLMGEFGAVVQPFVLAMLDAGDRAASWLLSGSVMMTRGTSRSPLRRLRKKRWAARWSRRG